VGGEVEGDLCRKEMFFFFLKHISQSGHQWSCLIGGKAK
jgi:hypothetical protein